MSLTKKLFLADSPQLMLVPITTIKTSDIAIPMSHNCRRTVSPLSSRLRYTSLALVNQNRRARISRSKRFDALNGSLGMLEFAIVRSVF